MTRDERREAAAKLLDMAARTNPLLPALVEVLGTPGCAAAVIHLADLMEPEERTCRIYDTDHGFEDSIRCDACQMTFRRPWQPFKFCPNCGAKVVNK